MRFTRASNSRCFSVCGPAMNSSLETDWTGIGEGYRSSAGESWRSSSWDSMLMEAPPAADEAKCTPIAVGGRTSQCGACPIPMRLRINRPNFILGSILVLIIAVGGGAMAIRTLCDPVSIEARAKAKVKEKWDKERTVGSLDVKPFPRPVLTATDVTVEGFGRAERVTATLQMFPLLFGRVRPAHVLAEGV